MKINEEEWLNEMATAGCGDWSPITGMCKAISQTGIDKYWKHVGNIKPIRTGKEFEIYFNKNNLKQTFVIGEIVDGNIADGTKIFNVIMEMKLMKNLEIKHAFKFNKDVFNVDAVIIDETDNRNQTIATIFYKFLVKTLKYIILGDTLQYFGARKLWTRLSKHTDIQVDIINTETNKTIDQNVKLKHGKEDYEVDDRIWSYFNDKDHLRLILKDIKSSLNY